MLYALKRMVNNNNANSANTNNQNFKSQISDQQTQVQQKTNGMQSISQTLQKKFPENWV